ncbi:cold-shock' DNA-binding domain-containing protein [Dimargaris cristalligena]|uniref:Cold-shock' DNA-binding domain-containing protein n=1 Tax=Dimargaris cristalligena TaxID=215637 RepID=A0A4P9ZVR5_9FUNG|nr:cold-shock' DNA-binding domain-containing protein [Dimargaris cristalligena]|eukprot:RKP36942.1 cold-shock' DNA-binding domain-containing protein [Dimargaris cristalligena]
MSRKTGTVKFFNSQKGFGFILPDDPLELNNAEVFVHHSVIINNGGFKSLAEVEFDVITGPKGYQATNVTGPNGTSVQGDPRAGRNRVSPSFSPYGRVGYSNNTYSQLPPLYGNQMAHHPGAVLNFGAYSQGGYPADMTAHRMALQQPRSSNLGGFNMGNLSHHQQQQPQQQQQQPQGGYSPNSPYATMGSFSAANPLGGSSFTTQAPPNPFGTAQQNPNFNAYGFGVNSSPFGRGNFGST